jgi:putative MATE family efflux protein
MKPNTNLTEGAIGKTLVLFSLPILFGNMLQSLNGTVNAIWVGRFLGEASLAATSNANTVLFFLLGTVFGIGMAATILIGQSLGAKNVEQAKRVVGTSATFFFTLSAAVSLGGYFAAPSLLALMQMPADALPLAVSYLRIIFLAMPFLFGFSFLMMVLRGAGDAKTPFWFLLLCVGLDIVLNPLFIFGWGPVPSLGIAGSATASLIANITSLTALLVYLYRKQHFLALHRGEFGYLRPDRTILRALVVKGFPMGLQMIVVSLSMIVMYALVNGFGSQTTAAFGACMQLWNYIQMPSFAIMAAVSSMAAQNVGAGRWDRVGGIARTGVLTNFALTGSLVLLVYAFDRFGLGLFLPDNGSAIGIAQHINAIVVWSFVFFGISFVLFGIVRSTGAVMPPLIILFIALWLVRIPFALTLLPRWAADAVWWSFPLGSLTSVVLTTLYYRFGKWREARMLMTTPTAAPVAAQAAEPEAATG